MFLREVFSKISPRLLEGGNLSSQSPGWQGAPDVEADEIDLEVNNRSHMVGIVDQVLRAVDQLFQKQQKVNLWSPELLKSRQFLGGSSLHFLNTTGISDDEFKRLKPKVGDIDTQVDKQLEPQVRDFLTANTGKQIGIATLLGFSQGNEQYNALFQLADPPIKLQIDFEFGKYDPATNTPDEWFRFSHSSDWADIQASVKGVFHKYLYRSLSGLSAKEFYVAKLVGRGKARAIQVSDTPETDSTVSFAVSGSQGGGVSEKYRPYLDPATGKPMMKNGLPVMEPVEAKSRPYVQNLAQQFQMMFGASPTPEDSRLQQSFIGTLDLINKYVDPVKKPEIVEKFLDICFEVGSQMITKGDPARDAQTKFIAIDLMLQKLDLNEMRPRAIEMAKTYEDDFNEVEAYKKANPNERQPRAALKKAKALQQLAEAEQAAVKAQLRKGMPHLHDLKAPDFLDLIDELHDGNGRFKLQNIPLNVKVDGFGGRFGKNADGRPFMGTSRTEPRYEAGFLKYHQEKGTTDPDILGRAKTFDDLFYEMMKAIELVDAKLGPDFLVNKQVTCEVLFLPFATETDDGRLKFVGIHYNKLPKGVQLALVPFHAVEADTGEPVEDPSFIDKLLGVGNQGSVMFINNRLTQKQGLDVTEIINPLDNIEELKRIVGDTMGKRDKASLELKRQIEAKLQPIKDNLEQAIINDPNIVGKDMLGKDYEGIVINSRLGPIKVTSSEQRQIITNKNAAKAAARAEQPRENSNKTAVVAIGSFIGHKGHQELWNYTVNKAKEVGGDPYLFIGNAESKDDPIPPSVKVQTWHKLYPQYANNISTVTHEGGTLLQKIKHELINPLPGKPPRYDNIIIMVGEDRANMNIAQALMKAVNKFAGYEHVKVHLEVTPRGQGMSGTALRKMAALAHTGQKEQAMEFWRNAFNSGSFGAKPLPDSWIKHLMQVTQKGMGIAPGASVNVVDKRDPGPQKSPIEKPLNIKETNRIIKEMRAKEFIRKRLMEKASITAATPDAPYAGQGDSDDLADEHMAGLNHAVSFPSISMNKSNGSSYLQYRFGLAMAGAHPNPHDHMPIPMSTGGAFSGDPLIVPFSDQDLEIVKAAGKHIGAGKMTKLADRSNEMSDTNKISPVAKQKKNRYGI